MALTLRHVACRARGGLEAEREERQRIKDEEDERNRKNFEFMQEMRRNGWREVRWGREGLGGWPLPPAGG